MGTWGWGSEPQQELRLWGLPLPPAQPTSSPVVEASLWAAGMVPCHLVYVPLGETLQSGTWGSRQG